MKKINIQKFATGPVSEYMYGIYVRTNWATSHTVDSFIIEVSIGGHATTLTLTPTSSCTLYPFSASDTNAWGESSTTISSWGGYGSVDTVDTIASSDNVTVTTKTSGVTLNSYTIDETYFNTRGGSGSVAITLNVSQTGETTLQDRYSDAIGYYVVRGAWGTADLVLNGSVYKISSVPTLDQIELEEYYGANKKHIGWRCNELSPSDYTIEELQSLTVEPNYVTSFIGKEFWAIVEDDDTSSGGSSESSSAVGCIKYDSMIANELWLGGYEVLKVIYNGQYIYKKLDKLVGPFTYADLTNYTHEQMALSTHEELGGPAPARMCIFYYNPGGGVQEYIFEEGMTWKEYVNSDYNTNDKYMFEIQNGIVVNKNSYNIILNGVTVTENDIIVENATYEMDK